MAATKVKPNPRVMKNGAVSDAAKLIKPGKKATPPKVRIPGSAAEKKMLQDAMDKKMKSRAKSGNWGRGTI